MLIRVEVKNHFSIVQLTKNLSRPVANTHAMLCHDATHLVGGSSLQHLVKLDVRHIDGTFGVTGTANDN